MHTGINFPAAPPLFPSVCCMSVCVYNFGMRHTPVLGVHTLHKEENRLGVGNPVWSGTVL